MKTLKHILWSIAFTIAEIVLCIGVLYGTPQVQQTITAFIWCVGPVMALFAFVTTLAMLLDDDFVKRNPGLTKNPLPHWRIVFSFWRGVAVAMVFAYTGRFATCAMLFLCELVTCVYFVGLEAEMEKLKAK